MNKKLLWFNSVISFLILVMATQIIRSMSQPAVPLSSNNVNIEMSHTVEPVTPSIDSKAIPITVEPRKSKMMLDAPLVNQLPELRNGCELTSLTMLLQYYGIKVDKMELVPELKKDPAPIVYNDGRLILSWGDPEVGFVGDITGRSIGYGVYNQPLFELLKRYIKTAVNLSGSDLETLENQLSTGAPVVVWTTVTYTNPPEKEWREWKTPEGKVIRATFKEHSVLVVGYDEKNVYINDPLSGGKQVAVDKQTFLSGWNALGKQAISYDINN